MNTTRRDNVNESINASELKTSRDGDLFFLFDRAYFDSVEPQLFSADYWQQQHAIEGSAKGRGTTWFIRHNNQPLVLRHYYRGGMIGRILNDQYFFTGFTRTRAYREFMLLWSLRQADLPVPTPVAVYLQRKHYIYYSGDIIATRVTDSQSLVSLMKREKISPETWQRVGACIRRFHDLHVYHHDLNAHNILIDAEEKIWLIDFDQGAIRQESAQWKPENLARLLRSLRKEKKQNSQLFWSETDWDFLREGYV